MFSNTKVIVTEIVMTQYIVASLLLSVISKNNFPKLPIYQNSWLSSRSKSFSEMSLVRRFLRLLKIMAPTF